MPNWVQTKVTITGYPDEVAKVQEQLRQPYQSEHTDWRTGEPEVATVEGEFLLWNIAKPDNLELYYERAETDFRRQEQESHADAAEAPEMSAEDVAAKLSEALAQPIPAEKLEEFHKKFAFDIQFGQDWYNWNVREWGTKWEIRDSTVEQPAPDTLIYTLSSAWAPPAEALTKLAKQYPHLIIRAKFHDENDCFAGEMMWAYGGLIFDTDLTIDHELLVELYGSCWACQGGNDYAEWGSDPRIGYGCPPPSKGEAEFIRSAQ